MSRLLGLVGRFSGDIVSLSLHCLRSRLIFTMQSSLHKILSVAGASANTPTQNGKPCSACAREYSETWRRALAFVPHPITPIIVLAAYFAWTKTQTHHQKNCIHTHIYLSYFNLLCGVNPVISSYSCFMSTRTLHFPLPSCA